MQLLGVSKLFWKVEPMAHVSVTINNHDFSIACDDGQEAHLSRLASYIDKRIDELVASIGQVGNERLLVMVSLLGADELSDVYAEIDSMRNQDQRVSARLNAEEAHSSSIEILAQRIEAIAESIERT
jgi:cell division protein ZapA